MEVADPRLFDRSGKLPLREAGPARDRPVADIDQGRDASGTQRRDDINQPRLLVADGEEFLRHIALTNPAAFPAKAGTHASRARSMEKWIPAFAGNAIFVQTR